MLRRIVIACALFCGGCPDHPSAMAPPDLAFTGICDDSTIGTDAAVPPTMANVQRLFDSHCIGCHCCDAYLKLSQGVSHDNLVGRAASSDDQGTDETCGGTLVVPGKYASSYLYQKISTTPCAGQQMPRAEVGFFPLPDCEQDLIRRWIDVGAPAQ